MKEQTRKKEDVEKEDSGEGAGGKGKRINIISSCRKEKRRSR